MRRVYFVVWLFFIRMEMYNRRFFYVITYFSRKVMEKFVFFVAGMLVVRV